MNGETIKFLLYSTVVATAIAVIFNFVNILLQMRSNRKIKELEKKFDYNLLRYNKIYELMNLLNSMGDRTFGETMELLDEPHEKFAQIMIPATLNEYAVLEKKYKEYQYYFTRNQAFEDFKQRKDKIDLQNNKIINVLAAHRNTKGEKPSKEFLELYEQTILEMHRFKGALIELCENELKTLTKGLNKI